MKKEIPKAPIELYKLETELLEIESDNFKTEVSEFHDQLLVSLTIKPVTYYATIKFENGRYILEQTSEFGYKWSEQRLGRLAFDTPLSYENIIKRLEYCIMEQTCCYEEKEIIEREKKEIEIFLETLKGGD